MRLRDLAGFVVLLSTIIYVAHEQRARGRGGATEQTAITRDLADFLALREAEAYSRFWSVGPTVSVSLAESPEDVLRSVVALGVPPYRVHLIYSDSLERDPFHHFVALPYGDSESLDRFLIEVGLSELEKVRAGELELLQSID